MTENNINLFNVSVMNEIELESCKDSCIIGEIFSMEYYKNRFYIYDRKFTKSIFIYDSTGNFINKTKKGKGPGETNFLMGFYIDTILQSNNKLIAFDVHKIIRYDLSGNYIDAINTPKLVVRNSIRYNEDKLLVFSSFVSMRDIVDKSYEDYKKFPMYIYALINNEFNVEYNNYFPFPVGSPETLVRLKKGMSSDNNKLNCIVPYDNHIYAFNGKDMIQKYFIDFG